MYLLLRPQLGRLQAYSTSSYKFKWEFKCILLKRIRSRNCAFSCVRLVLLLFSNWNHICFPGPAESPKMTMLHLLDFTLHHLPSMRCWHSVIHCVLSVWCMTAKRTFSFIRELTSVYEMALMYLNWHGGSRATFDKGHERFKIGRSVGLTTFNRQGELIKLSVQQQKKTIVCVCKNVCFLHSNTKRAICQTNRFKHSDDKTHKRVFLIKVKLGHRTNLVFFFFFNTFQVMLVQNCY